MYCEDKLQELETNLNYGDDIYEDLFYFMKKLDGSVQYH